MKIATVIWLFTFFFSVFAVRGQTDISALQFPYFDIQLSGENHEFAPSYFLPCPYADLLSENHIQSVKLYGSFESDLQYIGYYFNRNGRTDSIVYSYPTALGHYRKEFLSRYLFHYNKEGQIDRVNCFYDDYFVSQCGILYSNGIVKETRQIIFEDTVYTRYIVAPDSSSVKIVFSGNSAFSDTIFAADPVLEEVWIFPDEYFLSKKGKSQVFALKDRKAEQKHYSILKNKNGKTTSISMFDLWPEYQEPVSYSMFKWSETGILSSITQADYISPNNYNNAECFTNNNIIYKCFFNEEYLPDSILWDEKITAVGYKYFDDIFRWSPCNNKGKRSIDDWVAKIESLHFIADSLQTKTVKQLFICDGFIVKSLVSNDTCWFKNDRLVLLKNQNEAFWYNGDSLVGYEKYIAKKGEKDKDIVSIAARKKEFIYGEMSKIQPVFGVRILLNNIEPEVSIGADYMSFEVVVNKSEVESLKELKTNDPDFEVVGYYFMPDFKGCDFIEWHIPSGQITDKEMKYLQMENLTKAYFVNIEVKNSKGESRVLDIMLRVIRG